MTECDVARPFGASPRLRTVSCHERPKPDHYYSRLSHTPLRALWSYGLGLSHAQTPPVGRRDVCAGGPPGSPGFTRRQNLCCGGFEKALSMQGVFASVPLHGFWRAVFCGAALQHFCGTRQRTRQGLDLSACPSPQKAAAVLLLPSRGKTA